MWCAKKLNLRKLERGAAEGRQRCFGRESVLPTVCPREPVLTSFDAVTIKACFMPNIDFYFPA